MSWLLDHAIDPDLAKNVGVTGQLGGEIRFLYSNTGDEGDWFTRRRLPDGKTLQPKDVPLELYWPVGGHRSKVVMLCEGEGDTLAAATVLCDGTGEPRDGLPEVLAGVCPVGLPGVGAWRCAPEALAHATTVYTALDADAAGEETTGKLIPELTEAGVDVIPLDLPEGYDLAKLLQEWGALATRITRTARLVENATAAAPGRRQKAIEYAIRKKLSKRIRTGEARDEYDDLKEIDTAAYVELISGEEVPPSGFIHCPFPGHDDRTPSFQVYPGNRGWFCRGACDRGGDIYAFAMEVYGCDFKEAKRRLCELFPNTRTAEGSQ